MLAIKAYQAMDTGLIDKYLSPTMRNLGMREENIAARHLKHRRAAFHDTDDWYNDL